MNDRLPAIEPDARDLLTAVRELVGQISGDTVGLQMQRTDAERGLYALGALEKLFPDRLQALVAAHDALAAALNAACPGAAPVILLTTEDPA